MKRKQIPLIVMLLAGAVTSISTKIMHYELETALWILLAVLIVFYIAGCVIKRVMDSFEAERIKAESTEEDVSDEGEVIEKDGPQEGADTGAEEEQA
ncbi:MAG: hypothetical protein HFI91_10610 [Lachnospiraceae bacterium]|jgi:Na+-translocating ferredoxin:NAD+ oxidoreductase RnfE subunit|nr:hypothetical protein [Lachnospiraceae bacterium]